MLKSFSASVIHLLFVLLVISTGGLIILSALLGNLQNIAIHFLLQYPEMPLYFGVILMFFGLLLFSLFYQMHKGRYYKIKMGLIKESIIQEYVQNYWRGLFPNDSIEVILHSNQTIELVTNRIITTPEALEKIRVELGRVLRDKLGYRTEITLTTLITG